jgi:hypothetical protein
MYRAPNFRHGMFMLTQSVKVYHFICLQPNTHVACSLIQQEN